MEELLVNVPGKDSVLMFGGSGFDSSGSEIFFNDLWEFAGGKWARLSDGAHVKGVAWPSARRAHTGVLFDDDTMVVFGEKMTRESPWTMLGRTASPRKRLRK